MHDVFLEPPFSAGLQPGRSQYVAETHPRCFRLAKVSYIRKIGSGRCVVVRAAKAQQPCIKSPAAAHARFGNGLGSEAALGCDTKAATRASKYL